MYPWQSESNIHLPGGAISVAHQFLRCVLHQLAPNGIFTQMFQTNATGMYGILVKILRHVEINSIVVIKKKSNFTVNYETNNVFYT